MNWNHKLKYACLAQCFFMGLISCTGHKGKTYNKQNNNSILRSIDIIKYSDLIASQQTCWVYNTVSYHAINNLGHVVNELWVTNDQDPNNCQTIPNANYDGRDHTLKFASVSSDINNISDNDIVSGAVDINLVGYSALQTNNPIKIQKLKAGIQSDAMISGNGVYLFPEKFMQNTPRSMVEITTNSYKIIPLIDSNTGTAITTGDIRMGSSNGTLILDDEDGADQQYICNNSICKLLDNQKNELKPIRFPLISDNGKFIIANFIEDRAVYEIDPETAKIKGEILDSSKYDIDFLEKVFNNGVFMFYAVTGYHVVETNFFIPKSEKHEAKVVRGSTVIDTLSIPGVHGKDFIVEQISNDGKSFVLENLTALNDENPIESNTVLNVIVRNNPVSIWEI